MLFVGVFFKSANINEICDLHGNTIPFINISRLSLVNN